MATDGDTLRLRNEHFEMADWQQRTLPNGVIMVVPCDLGTHYLAPAGAGVQKQLEPHIWPDSRTAWAAVDQWRQEHQ